MTLEAKHLIAEIRLIGSHGSFAIVHKMLNDYFRLWGWKYYGGGR